MHAKIIKSGDEFFEFVLRNKYFYFIFTIGILLRLVSFFMNRSLWFDEAALAPNIFERSFTQLLLPLDNTQVAPILFLWIEKFFTLLFGNGEMALRLLLLLCGIFSLPLIYFFTYKITGNKAASLMALFFFSCSTLLIRYATEVKQYECDVFVALCLLNLTTQKIELSNRQFITAGIAGCIFIFLSNITVLVLFSIGIYFLLKYKLKILMHHYFILMVSLWIITFCFNYFLFIYQHPSQNAMLNYWNNSFMPLNIFSNDFLSWMNKHIVGMFQNLFSVPLLVAYILSIFLFTYKKNYSCLFFLLFPLLLHLIISGFKLYPFETRLIIYLMVFILPILCFAIVIMLSWIINKTHFIVCALLFAILLAPVYNDLKKNIPIQVEEIKASISFINKNYQPSQHIYIYYGALMASNYYYKIGKFNLYNTAIKGMQNILNPENYLTEINNIDGETWLLFSHVNSEKINEQDFILHALLKRNKILKSFKTKGSAAFLLSNKSSAVSAIENNFRYQSNFSNQVFN